MKLRSWLLAPLLLAACGASPKPAPNAFAIPAGVKAPAELPPVTLPADAAWTKLATAKYPGKQDDFFFVDKAHGWYVNGAGKLYRTGDGGATWTELLTMKGTYFRSVGFVDEKHGFVGNIGTDYFPGVTDPLPLYETFDGGATLTAVKLPASPIVKGICAIDILHKKFVDAGHLEDRVIIHAAGRVGGPAYIIRSIDGGKTWSVIDLNAQAAFILDVKFFDEMNGLVFAASDADMDKSHALILRTSDGGVTWTNAYESTRPLEMIWKGSFATRDVGYATVMSYDEDPAHSQRYVAKTIDGGKTWNEIPLANDPQALEFGIGFVTPDIGWVGTGPTGYQTIDGGTTWTKVTLGQAANKIRVVRDADGFVAYSIGVDVYKLSVPAIPSKR